MARAVSRTWYRIALARPDGSTTLVCAEGEHLGVAVAAAERFVQDGRAIAAGIATGGQIPLGESVGKDRVAAVGGAAPEVGAFRWPSGVLPQLDIEPIAPARGFVIHPDPALLVIEAQTEADQIIDAFLGLIEKLPAADNLEVRVLDHFENAGVTDVWLTSRVNGNRIVSFLDDNDVELIGNGHVEISIYVREHRATLRLTEHKTIVWLAERGDTTLEAEMVGWLRELELPKLDRLVTVTRGPHFHYRPAKSRSRAKLSDHLYRQRLRKVDKLLTQS